MNVALVVHRLLTDPRGWRVDLLCEELGWQPRTFRKHKQRLTESFGPWSSPGARLRPTVVQDGPYRYFRLVEQDEFAHTDADFSQRLATLAWMRQLLSILEGTSMGESAESWEAQARDAVRDAAFVFRDWLRDLDRMLVCVPRAPKDYREHSEQLDELLRAVLHTRRVLISYAEHATAFEFEPWSLLLHDSAIYVYGERPGIGERMLAVDRVSLAHVLKTKFRYPSQARYSPQRVFSSGFGVYVDDSSPREVELVVEDIAWLKRDVRERHWHDGQRLEELDDGRLRLRFRTNGVVDVAHWLFGRGPYVECVSPTLAEWIEILEDAAGPTHRLLLHGVKE